MNFRAARRERSPDGPHSSSKFRHPLLLPRFGGTGFQAGAVELHAPIGWADTGGPRGGLQHRNN